MDCSNNADDLRYFVEFFILFNKDNFCDFLYAVSRKESKTKEKKS